MGVRPLSSLPAGSNVFVDANIFVYAFSGISAQCAQFIERCAREEVTGITLLEVVNEATHRWMLAEAQAKGVVGKARAESLRRKRDAIPGLTEYWRHTERVLALNLLFLSSTEAILRSAQAERVRASLLTNDSIIVATMKHYGISAIASRDADFERAAGVLLYSPDDIAP
jgi:predicted nucleic acid-binding protein